MNTYRFLYDENYIIESILRSREQHKLRTWVRALKTLCFVGLLLLLAIILLAAVKSTRAGSGALVLLALVPALFMALLVWGHHIDFALLKRRLKRSTFYGGEACVSVAESGVTITTPKSKLSLSWSALTKASRLRDGFLVSSDPSVYLWWPDKCLTEGSQADVVRLLSKHLSAKEEESR